MRVLDIDLDMFLEKRPSSRAPNGMRLPDEEYVPWDVDRLVEFLECNFGLSLLSPVEGCIVTNHQEAFYWWKELIHSMRLSKPFEVVHVDSHSDLGSGSSVSMLYVGRDLLHKSVEDRESPEEGPMHMNEGNYLLVAMSCNWLSKLVFVAHPDSRFEDCEDWLFPITLNQIHLMKLEQSEIVPLMTHKLLSYHPPVDFIPAYPSAYKETESFDFMVLCQSPRYTPAISDVLIPIIRQYMTLP